MPLEAGKILHGLLKSREQTIVPRKRVSMTSSGVVKVKRPPEHTMASLEEALDPFIKKAKEERAKAPGITGVGVRTEKNGNELKIRFNVKMKGF